MRTSGVRWKPAAPTADRTEERPETLGFADPAVASATERPTLTTGVGLQQSACSSRFYRADLVIQCVPDPENALSTTTPVTIKPIPIRDGVSSFWPNASHPTIVMSVTPTPDHTA